MLEEYDFSNGIKNPYVKKLKKQVTINIEEKTIEYFKGLSKKYGIPYQTLINMYLSECSEKRLQPKITWQP